MNKFSSATVILLLSAYSIYGQISTREAPVSSQTNVPELRSSTKTVKSFAPLDMLKIEQEDKADEAKRLSPRYGYCHMVDYALENSGEWTNLPDGSKLWRLEIACSGALSINLLYDQFWLPEGAKFWIYGNDRKQSIGAFTSANNNGDRNNVLGFATALVYGDRIALEYFLHED